MNTMYIGKEKIEYQRIVRVIKNGSNSNGVFNDINLAIDYCNDDGDVIMIDCGEYDATYLGGGSYYSGGLNDRGKSIIFVGVPGETILICDGRKHSGRDTHCFILSGQNTKIYGIHFKYYYGNRTTNYNKSLFFKGENERILGYLINCMVENCQKSPLSLTYGNGSRANIYMRNCFIDSPYKYEDSYSGTGKIIMEDTILNGSIDNIRSEIANYKEVRIENLTVSDMKAKRTFLYGGIYPWGSLSVKKIQEITEPLSEEVFLSEGLNKIEGWNELHEHNGEIICLTDFFGDDVEVLVYEEEPDEDNPLQLEFEANYSPIDEAGDNLELLAPAHLEELQIEGMTAQPVYAISKEMDKSILYNMSDPYIMGNGKAKISVSQDKLNWTHEILVKDISLDWINALPNKLFIKLSFENCKHCFVGYLSLLDWQMFADEPIMQNDITSVVQNFYSGAYDIPNHRIEASFNDGVNWVTVYENKINQIAASAIQTGKLRLRITGTKNQTLYPFSFSWTEK